MTVLTRAICRRAGWDYEQIIVEQAMLRQPASGRRPRYSIGYGAHFSAVGGLPGTFADTLREEVDRWNNREDRHLHLTISSYDGWLVGDLPGEFVHFTYPGLSLDHLMQPTITEYLTPISDYAASSSQEEALCHFLTILALDERHSFISAEQGAFQVTYFQP